LDFPPVSSATGGVTARIFDGAGRSSKGKPVSNFDDIIASFKTSMSKSTASGYSASIKPRVVAFALTGEHTVEVS
jgi:hypothetical protein